MPLRTQGVCDLVKDAIAKVDKPYGEDIIEDVCLVIENDSALQARYDQLCNDLRKWVVNNWIGQYVKIISGMATIRQVPATRAMIVTSYSKLRPW